jgi:hypothetical protein
VIGIPVPTTFAMLGAPKSTILQQQLASLVHARRVAG